MLENETSLLHCYSTNKKKGKKKNNLTTFNRGTAENVNICSSLMFVLYIFVIIVTKKKKKEEENEMAY